MADLISTPGGQIHKRNQRYVDDGDGSHSEVRSVNLYVYDTGLLAWRKLVPADFAGGTGTQFAASGETSTVYNASTPLTPMFAPIVASSSGATQVVAAVAAKQIRVLNYTLLANAAVNVKWQSHVAGDVTGLLYLAANTGAAPAYTPTGHFQTVAGEALDINLSGNVAIGGHLTYITV